MKSEYPKFTGKYKLDPNPIGTVRRWKLLWREPVAVYDFTNDPDDPLTFWLSETEWIRPFRHFDKCDFGSVPLILQGLVSPTCAPRSFILHDSGYEFHAWWTPRGMEKITQSQMDDALYTMARAEGCNKVLAGKIWAGVRAGGWTTWPKDYITVANENRYDRAEARESDQTPRPPAPEN